MQPLTRDQVLTLLRDRGPMHCTELRRALGDPCPIEFSMLMGELVADGAAHRTEMMLPKYSVGEGV